VTIRGCYLELRSIELPPNIFPLLRIAGMELEEPEAFNGRSSGIGFGRSV
jgi:hypothetical protein